MTRDELNRRRMMFQINAKKNNLLKPEYEVQNPNVLRHSATNDYLEFRKKVAQGAKMQKEARVNLFNVTEANEQYRQELADKTILVHTGAGGMTNAYVAKLDDFYGPGKPRYFYTKEEWEGYQRNKQGASQAGAQRGAKEGADAKNKNLATSAADAYTKSKANETKQQIKESFNKLTGKNKPDLVGGREAAEKAGQKTMQEQATIESNKNKAREIGRDSKRWEKYNTEVGNIVLKNVLNSDPRFKEMKKNVDFANYPGGPEKGFNDLEEAVKKGIAEYEKNAAGAKNAGADRAKKESAVEKEKEAKADDRAKKLEDQQNKREEAAKSGTKTTESYTEQVKRNTDWAKKLASKNDDGSLDEAGKDYVNWVKEESLKDLKTPERHKMEKDIIKDAKQPGATYEELTSKYNIPKKDIQYILWFNGIEPPADNKEDLDRKRSSNRILNKWSKEDAIRKSSKGVKHSSEEDGITTDAMTPEQEYLNFRTKVESGLKHFGQTRGLISIPINQALKNGESLAHASYGGSGMTNKYYAKIDDFWGKGKPRYFYSKEEWDGYQKNKQGAGQAGADRAKKEKYNANYESNIKKNEGYAQNAGADRAKQEKLSYAADSARKDVDNLFKDGYQQTNEKIALNSKIKDDYVHDAFNQALAEANGTTVENLRKDPGLRSKLLEEFYKGTDYEKVIKVSQLMNNYYDALIDQDTNYVLNSIDFVKDYYHNGNPTGKGNTYSTSYKKDGFAIAKDLEDKWNTAIGNGKKNKSEVYIDFLKSLTDDEREVINMVNDYHYNNRLPGLLRQSQEGREAAEKEGQMITRRNTERNKYHMLNN